MKTYNFAYFASVYKNIKIQQTHIFEKCHIYFRNFKMLKILQNLFLALTGVNVLLQMARYRSGDTPCLGMCMANVLWQCLVRRHLPGCAAVVLCKVMSRDLSYSRTLIVSSQGICPMLCCSGALQGAVSHAARLSISAEPPTCSTEQELYFVLCCVSPSGAVPCCTVSFSPAQQTLAAQVSQTDSQCSFNTRESAAQVLQTGIPGAGYTGLWQRRFRRQGFAGEVLQTGILVCDPLCLRELCCVYLVLGAICHSSLDLAGQADIRFSLGCSSLPA